ncbi:XdhC family protein [Ruegeria meonggei]|uniref:Putative xanthine dehydrogenase subunit A n=1 Tax=Ruegeria meonggei TaxID=1446476 RepID=A0A1X6Z778_9RHOB|nr:XdhC family protein [Ruegeria meonggei]SLN42381.1 putative xanthine dehydrogenase subunit A [Ruegeria meonggei]
MASFDIFDTIDELRSTGEAFCVATVLRTADATSAKAGGKAAITKDGRILGHLGGACVQRAVQRSAQEALAIGAPRMIRVKPSEKVVNMTDPDGVQTFKSGCPSGGTVDLLVEPYQHAPRLVIFGESQIAIALAAHGVLAGFRVCVTKDAEIDADVRRFTPETIAEIGIDMRDFVVVASQGSGDATALKAALETDAMRVSMVASRRKADMLTDKLVAQGMDPARAAQLKSPAGLDIQAIDPHEIALSILAEIVQWRNRDKTREASDDEKRA